MPGPIFHITKCIEDIELLIDLRTIAAARASTRNGWSLILLPGLVNKNTNSRTTGWYEIQTPWVELKQSLLDLKE